MKKIILGLLIASYCCFGLLSGCGQKGNLYLPPPPNTSPTPTTP